MVNELKPRRQPEYCPRGHSLRNDESFPRELCQDGNDKEDQAKFRLTSEKPGEPRLEQH